MLKTRLAHFKWYVNYISKKKKSKKYTRVILKIPIYVPSVGFFRVCPGSGFTAIPASSNIMMVIILSMCLLNALYGHGTGPGIT